MHVSRATLMEATDHVRMEMTIKRKVGRRKGMISFLLVGLFLWFAPVRAQSPHGSGFVIDCAKCHVPDNWSTMVSPLGFDHDSTALPLVGLHVKADCRSCHSSLRFDTSVMTDCVACHTDVHAMTVGNDCARCHTPRTWLVDDIPELHEQNGFPLVGAHYNLSCVDCHVSDNTLTFARIGNDCINCHQADYKATREPDHAGAGFSQNCVDCHDPMGTGWTTDLSNHDFFPLTGGHDIQDCARCHATGNFSDASPVCSSCHMMDYTATVDPNHTLAGFSTDCASCHTTGPGWSASFDHNITDFPLHGTHATTDCIQCHSNGYAGTPTVCIACHINEYNGTTEPDHVASGFSTDCALCHDETAWGNATFDHNNTAFPLHGSHTTTACIECHANGFAGTPTACSACHMADYNSTSNPNHAAAQFPTDCAACHNEGSWAPATFDHDPFFPIYSGRHDDVWNNCATCHTDPNNYGVFNCTNCHNDQADLADEHDEVSGYSYNSNACYSCHPDGTD